MKLKQTVWIFSLLLIITPLVSAFGVTAPYWKENPLRIGQGEEKEIIFTLQNMVDESDLHIVVELLEDPRYVTLIGPKEVDVPVKTKDVPVTLKVMIPKDTPLGTEFSLRVSFRSATKTGVQQVQLGTAIEKTFKVIVGPVPEKQEQKYSLLQKPATPAAIIILAVFILWFFLRKSRKNKSGKAAFAVADENARW